TVISPSYDAAGEFSDGLAAVQSDWKWGYIDTSGKMVIKPQFVAAQPFADGLAVVEITETAPQANNAPAHNAPAKNEDGKSPKELEVLGYMYENGGGVTQDFEKARQLYQQAADAGNSDGNVSLGLLYEDGKGVAQDYTKAAEYY